MSKKRLAASLLMIVFAVLFNMLIINYRKPLRAFEATVNVTMTMDHKEDIQVFYTNGEQDSFLPELSQVIHYSKVNSEEILSFNIPADATSFRLDFGTGKSSGKILKIDIEINGVKVNVPVNCIQNVLDVNDAEANVDGDGLQLISDGKDPYVIWNTENWPFDKLLDEIYDKPVDAATIAICACVDIFVLLVLVFFHRAMIIPKELWHNRKLIIQLAKNDFKTKFAGSYLGTIWAFVQPIVTVLVYWFVFEKGLKAGGINTKAGIAVPFVLWLVAGLVPWFFFQEAWNGGTNALVEYSYLVKKVVFKISVLPIVKVLSALFVHLFFIVFTLVLYVAYGYYPDLYTLQIFYYSFGLFILVLGLSYATSALVGFFKDLTQIINIILQVGVWMTPIMWNIDTMELSPILITIFKLNPMYYIVAGYRDALINKIWFWENPGLTLYFWIFTIVTFGVGVLIFKRLKIHFADVL